MTNLLQVMVTVIVFIINQIQSIDIFVQQRRNRHDHRTGV